MHINTNPCPSCEEKLKGVHPDLVRWVHILRNTHPEAHVSCGARGEADQEDAYRTGHSDAHYGQSPHNAVPAMAVDLFRLTQQAGASFDRPWYRDVVRPVAEAAGLIWGGSWKHRIDMPHVELPGFKPFK